MDVLALVLSIAAVLISGAALGWQIRRWWWEQRPHLKVEGRSLTVVSDLGERIPVVGVRVTNKNPRYPLRVNAVAFTPATNQKTPALWFGGVNYELPRLIDPHDAETIDVPIDHISEVDIPLGPTFVDWIELKTGDTFHSTPHPR